MLTLNSWAKAPKNPGFPNTLEALASGVHLESPARRIKEEVESQVDGMPSVVVIPATSADNFEAQKLPYLLLPLRAIFVTDLSQVDLNNWQGHIVVISQNKIARNETVDSIIHSVGDKFELVSNGSLTTLLMKY